MDEDEDKMYEMDDYPYGRQASEEETYEPPEESQEVVE